MARPSAMAALLLLLVITLLAVTHCRAAAVAADHAAVTAEQQHGIEFLRLPSHHRVYYRDPAFRFDDYDDYSVHDDGEWRREAVSHLDTLPGAEVRETEEVKPVAEPDPDRSLPDSDGDGELVDSREPSSFADTNGHDGKPWKRGMLWRWLRYVCFNFHHGTRRHHLHHNDQEEEEATSETQSMNLKRFHFHHREEDEEKNIARKLRLRQAEHGEDSDDEDEEVEEMVWRFRKVFMRMWRRFGHDAEHGHRHRHAVEAEKQADGKQSGGIAWIKGLMNTLLNF